MYGYSYYKKHITLRRLLPEKTIALTFDDGPVPETASVISMLKDISVHATFFVLGDESERRPALVQQAFIYGNEIGNHTYDHPHYLGLRSKKFIISQIEKTNTTIENITGKKPKVFRTPFGESSVYSDHIAKQLGLQPFLWTLITIDWNTETTAEVLDAQLQNISRSEIILVHDRIYKDPAKLEILRKNIIRLQKEGFRFVTLSELY